MLPSFTQLHWMTVMYDAYLRCSRCRTKGRNYKWLLEDDLGTAVLNYRHGNTMWGGKQGKIVFKVFKMSHREISFLWEASYLICLNLRPSYCLLRSSSSLSDSQLLSSHIVSQVKCAQYWPSPDRETELYEEFIVKLNSEDHYPDYTIRRLSLTNVSLRHMLNRQNCKSV